MFRGPFGESIVKRAQEKGILEVAVHDLRRWTEDKRGTVDDRPYGGGPGMVLMVEPVKRALDQLRTKDAKVILLDATGEPFDQLAAGRLSALKHLILICGHYEGVDQRVKDHLVDQIISIGDYILTGGEIPAMALVDAVARLIPGALGKDESSLEESFSSGLLEYPQYTRPEIFGGWKVPEALLSGNHQEIRKWREKEALNLTKKIRPDLLKEDRTND